METVIIILAVILSAAAVSSVITAVEDSCIRKVRQKRLTAQRLEMQQDFLDSYRAMLNAAYQTDIHRKRKR